MTAAFCVLWNFPRPEYSLKYSVKRSVRNSVKHSVRMSVEHSLVEEKDQSQDTLFSEKRKPTLFKTIPLLTHIVHFLSRFLSNRAVGYSFIFPTFFAHFLFLFLIFYLLFLLFLFHSVCTVKFVFPWAWTTRRRFCSSRTSSPRRKRRRWPASASSFLSARATPRSRR